MDGDDAVMDARHSFGTDERRMHVRAYNYWTALLGDKSYPSIEDLDLDASPDFQTQGVLLDFTSGLENPAIQHLGPALADECGIYEEIGYISQVPPRSLLSRITDHYMQIIANKAPIGFEAEFVNQRGATILYRGILLPFSSDDDTIDFICGVINWKEMAGQAATDMLEKEVDEAIRTAPRKIEQGPVWADGPLSDDTDVDRDTDKNADGLNSLPVPDFSAAYDSGKSATAGFQSFEKEPLELTDKIDDLENEDQIEIPTIEEQFAGFSAFEINAVASEITENEAAKNNDSVSDAAGHGEAGLPENAGLADWLHEARATAQQAAASEERTRSALYKAIGRAYDFSVMAARNRDEFLELLDESGLTYQERAPMTPVVKLVFGSNYDKTRLTEYATALSHAHREEIEVGALADYLESYKGGLKAVVREERRLKRPEKAPAVDDSLDQAYAAFREATPVNLNEVESGDAEFVVLLARRDSNGSLGIVGSVAGDTELTDKVVTRASI
ncbi:hypothetical protein [Sphingorhabdus sp. Alg239-R122]|uniref:hypothetical protein n=1 Tax=Sphingorhabdus sp. Alg239-R122 TaxID=2305989 RepID=UPI001F07BB26|nr:hypothetical protein [Sphingorhabdus sp. Alg239-R122]